MIVKSIRKSKNLYEVTFETEVVKYHEEVIVKYNLLKSNVYLSDEEFNNSLLDNRCYLLYDFSLKYVTSFSFLSKIKKKLLLKEDKYIVDKVLQRLIDNKLVNDYEISCLFLESKYKQGYGSLYVVNKLKEYMVEEDIINKVVDIYYEYELKMLNKYIIKVCNCIKYNNKKDYVIKIKNRLLAHGYKMSDIEKSFNLIDVFEYYISNDNIEKSFNKAIDKFNQGEGLDLLKVKVKRKLYQQGYDSSDIDLQWDRWINNKGE